ncbi:MAG TPA: polysaccharide lyase family 7 protein [Nannocystaceae bacterium]|nr:polysaccharide lyase family 7 protein [Nannocystaceae bacterium]
MRRTPIAVVLVLACGEGDASTSTETSTASTTSATSSSSTTGVDATTDSGNDGDASSAGSSGALATSSGIVDGGTSDTGTPAMLPAELLDLSDWKLTLPIGSRRDPESPREVLQPELATFAIDPWFVLDGDAVRFRAHAGGVTTSSSGYPRSELREMSNDGADEAAWSTSSGVHTMTITQTILQLPEVKPHVVAGQIHDADDDVVMIRLEGEHLFVEGGGDELGDLDAAYQLGTEFTVQLVAHDGTIDVYYEDLATPAVSVARDVDGCYFKAGVYTQSNEEQGDAPEAYGEVAIRELVVTHE